MGFKAEEKALLARERSTYPEFLYKYRSGSDAHLKSLRDDQIWFSKPAGLNDPHDCRLTVTTDLAVLWHEAIVPAFASADGEIQFIPSVVACHFTDEEKAQIRASYEQQAADLQNENAQMGVYCMCESPLNDLMWTHYANGYSGFCIEYPFRSDTFDLEHGRWPAKRMDYRDHYPYMDMGVLTREPQHVVASKFFYYKSGKYRTEQEWRSIARKGDIAVKSPPMTAIVFGVNASDALIQSVRDSLASHAHQPQLKRLTKVHRSYDYEIGPLA